VKRLILIAALACVGCAAKPKPKDINHDGEVWFCEQLTGAPCEEKK